MTTAGKRPRKQRVDLLLVERNLFDSRSKAQAAIMAGQVKQFSPAELKTLAAYIGSLPGELRTVPQSKFR